MRDLLFVTGSREFVNEQLMEEALSTHSPHQTILIHGGCRGADRVAVDVAVRLGWEAIVEVPYLGEVAGMKFGKKGGPLRNGVMAKMAATIEPHQKSKTWLYAFPTASSRGTWDCVAQFRAAGIEVIVFR